MSLASTCIERPVFSIVLSILIVHFGCIGFTFLGVREFPNVDPPIVTVTTNYTGANAEVVESQITEPLEESINGVAGIRTLSSISGDGRSTITVEFVLGTDMETAANDVRDRVSRAIRNLPTDAEPPTVAKQDADANPIVSLTIQSDRHDLLQLSAIANDVFKERLQTIPGVSEIRIWGEKKYAMKLLIDPAKLAAKGLSPLDVRSALGRENIELPSGRIEGNATELSIRTFGRLTSPDEFNDLIIKEVDGSVVRLRDIGEAVLAPENERTILRGNGGVAMVAVAISPQPGANHIQIIDEFYRRVEQIKRDLPEGMRYTVALDTTQNIRKAITEVGETILIAFLLVLLVIFAFLRQWRTTMIPMLAIPISLVGTFFIMYLAGFSINILSLLGIVLATGIVVDDAIVVLENIFGKIERGMDPRLAAHEGSREIYFAILSTTVTLAAVFLPIIFLQGLTGRLFREFGIVVAGAIVISAFVSLTLTPMMSGHTLRAHGKTNKFFERTEAWFNALTAAYSRSLQWFVARRRIALVIMLISVGMIFGLGSRLKSELAPLEDKSRFVVNATAPEGTSFDAMDAYLSRLIKIVDTLPERDAIVAVTSPSRSSGAVNTGFVRVNLTPPETRTRSQKEIAAQVTRQLKNENFGRVFVTQEETIGGATGGNGLSIQYVIQAPTLEKLKQVVPKFLEAAQNDPTFAVVDVDLKFNKPELGIQIDRDRARALGVTVGDVAEVLQLYFSGSRYGYFIFNGKQYSVIAQADRGNRNDPLDLSSVFVRNNRGDLIQLDNLVTMSQRSSPPQLYRYNRYASATISASPAAGSTIGDGIAAMDRIRDQVLDESCSTSLAGAAKEFSESSNTLFYAFILALVLVYLILSAQFESFVDPLTIMLTVPLALAGAVLSLWLFGQTLNIFSQIGIIALVGIVTKNGILIVEFANQQRARGLEKVEAVLEASTQRFRPILMTSLATVFGAVPIAFAIGAGSTSRISMGIVIIGGLLFSLVLTLYIIPSLYTYLSRARVHAKAAEPHLEAKPLTT